jgi:hypothetical protein
LEWANKVVEELVTKVKSLMKNQYKSLSKNGIIVGNGRGDNGYVVGRAK